jgi:hypothetical protein
MKLMYLPLILLFSQSILAQAQQQNLDDSITHIEIYGETGKGDTAIISFKNGGKKKVYLANKKAREKFHKQYKNEFPIHVAAKDMASHPHDKNADEAEIAVPDEIIEYTYNPDNVTLKLRNGKTEFYNLKDTVQKKTFIEKYNNFLKF